MPIGIPIGYVLHTSECLPRFIIGVFRKALKVYVKIIPTWFLVGHEIGEGNFDLVTYAKDFFGLVTYGRIVFGHNTCIRVIVADLRSVPNISIN